MLHAIDQPLTLPCTQDIQRQVHRGPVQIARGGLPELRGDAALQQLDKNRLQHVFGVLTVAGDRIGRPIHQLPVLPHSSSNSCDKASPLRTAAIAIGFSGPKTPGLALC